MIEIGKKNVLTVMRSTSPGLFLADEENNEVLLPNKYVDPKLKVNDKVEVFVYTDSEDRIIATNLEPLIQLNGFAYLRVRDVSAFGAFIDWGLEKDLLVPFNEQNAKMIEGNWYVIYLYLDEETQRLVGSARVNRFLDNTEIKLEKGQQVDLMVFDKTDLGFKVIVDNQHSGLVYHNEVFQDIKLGDKLIGYVKTIREDNKLDITLQQTGFAHMGSNTEQILDYLKKNKGVIPLTDKSSPDDVYAILKMSKKNFKKAIGILYKDRVVRIANDGVYLVHTD